MTARQSIVLLIRSLQYGGAEKQITVLANGLARSGHTVSLLVFYAGGPLFDRVSSQVTVRCLQKRHRWHVIGFLGNFFSVLSEMSPDVLYSFLPEANILACLARLRFPRLRVVWGVRTSDLDLMHYGWPTRFSDWLERQFSHWPNLIISNSEAGRHYAMSRGFPDTDRFIVIPNGIDTELFRPNAVSREMVRREWGLLPQETLIGIVGRMDPIKDHSIFLEAAAKLARCRERLRFVSVGTGPTDYAALLKEKAQRLGLAERLIWVGPRGDMPAVYSALDLLVSSSFTESFSNVLGEAMACGIPCVATDVGDAREILGELGAVVPRSDPEALATAMKRMLERAAVEAGSLSARLRQQIVENYSVESLVQRTRAALETIR